MKKFLPTAILALASATSLHAASIVLVTDQTLATSDNWYPILNSYFNFGGTDTLSFGQYTDHTDTATINTLQSASLIVFTRNTNSGNYSTVPAEITFWNSLTAPIILSSNLVARTSRLGWASSDSTTVGDPAGNDTTLTAAGAGFFGLSAGAQDLFTNGNQGMANTNTLGGGQIYGSDTNAPLGYEAIYWAAGATAANGNTFGGKRLFLGTGNTFVLTATGTTAFNNAITAMIPEPSSMALLGLGLAAFAARRRR